MAVENWVHADGNSDPATGELICSLPDLDEAACTQDVEVAVNAVPALIQLTGRTRGDILLKWKTLMLDAAGDLAIIITSENGKPLAEARAEITYAAGFFGWFAGEAARIGGSVGHRPNSRHRSDANIKARSFKLRPYPIE